MSRRGQDELVVFPTPKEAFSRQQSAPQQQQKQQHMHRPQSQVSQQQQQQQQRMSQHQAQQQRQQRHGQGGNPGRKKPPTSLHSPIYGQPQPQQQQQQLQPQQQPQQYTRPIPQRAPSNQVQYQQAPPPQQGYQQQYQQGPAVAMPPQQPPPPQPQQQQVPQQAHQLYPGQQLQQAQYQQPPPTQQYNTGGSGNVPLYQQPVPQEIRQPNPLQQQNTSDAERLEMKLRELFSKVDRNHSGRLTEPELTLALYNTDNTQFQPSTVKVMIKLFDKDNSGAIDFREFYHLWNYVTHWRKVFTAYDKDNSNTISFSEYQETLKSFGYRLHTDTVLFVFQKFSHGGGGIYLKFDSYVESLIWLLRCTNSFKKFDTQETGVAVFPFDKYIQEVLGFQ